MTFVCLQSEATQREAQEKEGKGGEGAPRSAGRIQVVLPWHVMQLLAMLPLVSSSFFCLLIPDCDGYCTSLKPSLQPLFPPAITSSWLTNRHTTYR